MRVSTFGFDPGEGLFPGLNFSSSRSNGIKLSDTAGLISAPGALTPAFRVLDSGGGLNALIDASHLFNLDTGQQLWFGLTGDFHHESTSLAASALTPGGVNANAASQQRDIETLTASATYKANDIYYSGGASFDFSRVDITNNFLTPGAHGETNSRGYALDATVGRIFPLFNPIGIDPQLIAKAPPMNPGGYALFLDASTHFDYREEHVDGFTDSSGFLSGAQDTSYGDIGARARLVGLVPGRDFAWMPFVGATFDHQLGFKYTFNVPAQAAAPADTLILNPANNFWGAEVGFDILDTASVKFGMTAFYEASADIRTIGGNMFLKIPFEELAATNDSGIRIVPASTMALKIPPLPPPAAWSWAGLYLGGHVGGGLSVTNFADPFGPSIYGDKVRSPAFLGGGQIGYNWQAPGSRWVLGVEADGSLMSSDGSNTCFAASSSSTIKTAHGENFFVVNSTCRVEPRATGDFTGRVGYAFGPGGSSLIYGKAGLAWARDTVTMALNTDRGYTALAHVPSLLSNSQSATLWGGTVGVGVERALTPAWSVKVEYDYINFGHSNVGNVGNIAFTPIAISIAVTPPGTSAVSQNIQQVKVGLNYKWGADPWASGWASGWSADPQTLAGVLPGAGWEVEGGGRYFGSWGQFKKTFGMLASDHQPPTSDISRLTYSDMQTNSGEFFGRIDTPWNLFVKGYAGGGGTNTGHLNDEDNVVRFGSIIAAYSNTLSPAVDGGIRYGAIDGGYDFLRGPGYKIGAFAGYFAFNQTMNAFGCTAIASVNCGPNPVPTSGSPVVSETDKWKAVRIGLSAETMLTDRIKISGEAAYLPWVGFHDVDQHFIGNTGVLAEIFPASGNGNGVQLEALASYYLTRQWGIGLGARYWGMWTKPDGQLSCTFGCGPPTAPQFSRSQVEQFGAFVQTSYKLDWDGRSVAPR